MIKYAVLAVPKDSQGWTLEHELYKGVKQFGERLLKQGWEIKSKPQIQKTQIMRDEDMTYRVSQDEKFNLIVPTYTGMRDDHPWYEPEEDRYEIAFRVSRRPRSARIDLPESFIKKGLPAGLQLGE